MSDIGIIILAAGKSQRMGASKQLLKIGKNSLIQHVVKIAVASDYAPIVVVLGSNFEKIKKEITDFEVFPVFNNNWEKGMGTSIAKGIQEIQNLHPGLRAVIILLVDQPLLQPNLLNKLVNLYKETGKEIVASKYDKTIGVPALFDRSIFQELESLGENIGAKKLIHKFMEKEKAAFVNFPEGRFDLDTPEDYQRFLKDFGEK
jgi:molybdenum cofactor cytidylyltransferase